jgi:hypothetical protein
MKPLFRYMAIVLAFFIATWAPNFSYAQRNKVKLNRDILVSGHTLFRAQNAIPASGGYISLTSEYTLKLSKDTIAAYLPYYGRSYEPSIGDEGGIRFTSVSFDYTIKDLKKNRGWEVTITPRDTKDVRQLILTTSTEGNATLQVINLNRQPITFNGNVYPQ